MITFQEYMTKLGHGCAPNIIGQVPPEAVVLCATSPALIQAGTKADFVDPTISHIAHYRQVSLGYVEATRIPEYWVCRNDPADGAGITCWWFDRDPDDPTQVEVGTIWGVDGAWAEAAQSVDEAFAFRRRVAGCEGESGDHV